MKLNLEGHALGTTTSPACPALCVSLTPRHNSAEHTTRLSALPPAAGADGGAVPRDRAPQRSQYMLKGRFWRINDALSACWCVTHPASRLGGGPDSYTSLRASPKALLPALAIDPPTHAPIIRAHTTPHRLE
jgi:hypothetical protein